MIRSLLAATVLVVTLASGCATTGVGEDSEAVQSLRSELALNPQLNSAQVTVTEVDGVVNINGFVEDVQELNAVKDVVDGIDGIGSVQNHIVIRGS